jgi:hypothetical protein
VTAFLMFAVAWAIVSLPLALLIGAVIAAGADEQQPEPEPIERHLPRSWSA